MSDYRQMVVDAAVQELRHQLGNEDVEQDGTYVQVEGGFRMARVAEQILRAGLTSGDERIVQEVARAIAPHVDDWEKYRPQAVDAITAMWGITTALMDPLP
jgi:hypothetical protein